MVASTYFTDLKTPMTIVLRKDITAHFNFASCAPFEYFDCNIEMCLYKSFPIQTTAL